MDQVGSPARAPAFGRSATAFGSRGLGRLDGRPDRGAPPLGMSSSPRGPPAPSQPRHATAAATTTTHTTPAPSARHSNRCLRSRLVGCLVPFRLVWSYLYLSGCCLCPQVVQFNPDFVISSLNVHRLLITSIMLASKFFDDVYYNNAYYARVGGISNAEVNSLEMEMLRMISFSLFVQPDQYERYRGSLYSHVTPAPQHGPPGQQALADASSAAAAARQAVANAAAVEQAQQAQAQAAQQQHAAVASAHVHGGGGGGGSSRGGGGGMPAAGAAAVHMPHQPTQQPAMQFPGGVPTPGGGDPASSGAAALFAAGGYASGAALFAAGQHHAHPHHAHPVDLTGGPGSEMGSVSMGSVSRATPIGIPQQAVHAQGHDPMMD